MVLISYDLISFHRACALFIQCLYIQQWPARIAQLFPFMPERIRKQLSVTLLALLMSDHGQTTIFQILFDVNDALSNTQ